MTFARTHARRNNPDTSHDAAEAAEIMAAQHKARVYAALLSGPKTSQEVASETGLDCLQVMKRVSDLRNDGAIADSGARRLTKSGRQSCVWHIVKPAGGVAA